MELFAPVATHPVDEFTPDPTVEAAWDAYLTDLEVWPAEVTSTLDHLALYHDEEARYYGLAHSGCPLDTVDPVF